MAAADPACSVGSGGSSSPPGVASGAGGPLTAVPRNTQVRFHRMKTLLGDGSTIEGERDDREVVRRDARDPRRPAAQRPRRGQGREEPRDQGDGRRAAGRDDERAARRPRHQRRAGRPVAPRGARRDRRGGRRGGIARLRSERGGVGALRGDRRARRGIPHPDPVLRSAAAPARRGAHPRPRRLPHRRPADQLPHGRAARVRRDRRQDLRGHPHHRPERPAPARRSNCPTRASGRPSRCC